MIIMHSHDLILLRFEKFVIYPNTLVKCQNVDLSLYASIATSSATWGLPLHGEFMRRLNIWTLPK